MNAEADNVLLVNMAAAKMNLPATALPVPRLVCVSYKCLKFLNK